MGRSEARGGGTEGRRGTRRRQAAGTAERGQRAARGHRGKVADQFLVTDLTVGGDGGGVGPLWTSRLHRWRPASTVDPSPAVNPPWRDARGGGCGPCCLGTKSVRTALLTWRSGGEGGGGVGAQTTDLGGGSCHLVTQGRPVRCCCGRGRVCSSLPSPPALSHPPHPCHRSAT